MDINTLRIIATLAFFGLFLVIGWWTFSRSNRERFEEAAHIPFDQD